MRTTDVTVLPTLEGMAQFLRRSIIVLVLFTVAGGVIGWLVAGARPPTFVSTATVLLPEADPGFGTDAEPQTQTMDTLARLVLSEDVIDDVAAETDESPGDTVARLEVGAVPLSRLLVIRYTGDSPEQATAGAQQAADSLVVKRSQVFGTGGVVVQSASVPTGPERANSEVLIVSGALLGLLAGLVTSAFSDRTGSARRPLGTDPR